MKLKYFWVICITIPTLIPSWAGISHKECRSLFYPSQDSVQAVERIIGFLHWYQKNYSNVNEKGLSYADTNGWYQVDTLACRQYLDRLMQSGYFTSNYKKLWQEYFYSKAVYWESSPQNEGPPEGFDYDLVLLTQEPELFYDDPKKLSFDVVEMDKDFAVITATADRPLYFEMTKRKGIWMIEYISSEGYD